MKFLVGLTGGIGSGKSAVADMFAELGVGIVDADLSSRAVVGPGSLALSQIETHFGSQVLDKNGSLNRKALRQKVFESTAQRQWLEELLHPLIRAHIEQSIAEIRSPYGILVSPLLLETSQKKLVDRILVVDASESLQLERAAQRDNTKKSQIEAIMAAQWPRDKRLQQADDVIVNDTSLSALKQKVLSLHRQYLEHSEPA